MEIERRILLMLKDGYTQDQIASELKDLEITPNSLSSVEKNLKNIRKSYDAKTLFHLACILCDERYFEDDEY
ncbi:hypothetical protein EG349_10420 [Chryseobacterium shandongense]|uniref:Uncharacterized protein n=2 Tax=Chryseobacterium TaxID=59732 RepID=A0AAD0YEV0_9FLAO|nr:MULTISPECIES: hypothetical protein [Chryseobacterium]AZA87174.1 hypothetical protein EG349_10420 [Chryseobacterium shandongense]AZA95603.1 hypothetical protein EG353_08495 [Chryseobacterium shandongense]MEC3876118.1 hypothetical protein [Chryseobacterium sp. T9W2-O]